MKAETDSPAVIGVISAGQPEVFCQRIFRADGVLPLVGTVILQPSQELESFGDLQ